MSASVFRLRFGPDDERHGTYAGSVMHGKLGTPRCGPCKDAARRYIKAYRRTQASHVNFTFPLTNPVDRRTGEQLSGLGVTLALAWREMA